MKTPREILFEKHKGAEPKLDAIREAVVSGRGCPQPQQVSNVPVRSVTLLAALWQELFLPYRRIWAGLAAVWVGIIALRMTEPGTPTHTTVRLTPQMAAAVIVDQRRVLAFVLGERESPQTPLPPPEPLLPRPRSERRRSFFEV